MLTTEDDFQAMLDADPTDHGTRLVFADWLQERDDPRAEGYRALGAMRCHADALHDLRNDPVYTAWGWYISARDVGGCGIIPSCWFGAIASFGKARIQRPPMPAVYFRSRRAAEDAAALAFARLPAARRAELLGLTPAGA